MKIIIVYIIVCFTLFSHAAATNDTPDAVVVKVFDKPMPHETEKKERELFLWSIFTNKSEMEQFDSYGVSKWKENFSLFAKSLVQMAEKMKLDSASLSQALDLVLKDSKDEIAYLPIAAYQTTLDGMPIWIIPVKWEYPSFVDKDGVLSHIRVFAFDQKTLKQVAFVTCN